MSLIDLQPSIVLKNIYKLIAQNIPHNKAKLITEFAEVLFKNMSNDDVIQRNESNLYGAVLSLWHMLNEEKECTTRIEVFNPELAQHGWESPYTIIQITVKDMPFLVDSVRIVLNRLGISAHSLLHCPLNLERNDEGEISTLQSTTHSAISVQQTVFLIEIDHQRKIDELDNIQQELKDTLKDVGIVVRDWQLIRKRMKEVIHHLQDQQLPITAIEKDEALTFLNWLEEDHFTFMGYRHYQLNPIEGDYELVGDAKTSLGLMQHLPANNSRRLSSMLEAARKQALNQNLLILTKTNRKSRVHRPAYIDYVGVKEFSDSGQVIGEYRFIGLFSSSFYNNSLFDIPLLQEKLNRILERSGFNFGTHAYKVLLNILQTYPRDELIQAKEEELLETVLEVLRMQERDMTRLFVREDIYGRFVSCMVYVPRERYNTQLRRQTQALLAQAFQSQDEVEFTTYFSESIHARTQYVVRTQQGIDPVNTKFIEQNLIEIARTWDDKLIDALRAKCGDAQGKELANKYTLGFSQSYKDQITAEKAVFDIQKLESLSHDNQLEMLFFKPQEADPHSHHIRLKLYHVGEPIHLSHVLPILENFGLRVIGETPYKIKLADHGQCWILDFSMLHNSQHDFYAGKYQAKLEQAFYQVWSGALEDDGFNRLVLGANLTGREVSIIRAYAKYLRQIGSAFSQTYIENIFANYPKISQLLVTLFTTKFTTKTEVDRCEVATAELEQQLDLVSNLDDDRIIRRYVAMIQATTRTNYYQLDKNKQIKPYISFKIQPELIPDIPQPTPKYEIFVYSPRVEGVHLRQGKVARGGLRWSDRREDFRTEVLGLVKAQQVKNTVIVPVGAKGGFFCKQLPSPKQRDEFMAEGQACYKTFIRGLLDITDNIIDGQVVVPQDVVCWDEEDYYLVVAADKGTATFSDIANSIAKEYHYWLGDAFASGGSVGYDHKKMGITARGAWESVKRHFREIGVDCQQTPFTCIAIGDMSGDVFGNGMLLSEQTQLIAAFNHLHIFIDPAPDIAKSYAERQRLFALARSNWDDYNKSLISKGGGIFSRQSKSIQLTPEIKKMIQTKKKSLTPNELLQALLIAPVDLLWNGGIGTYLKAENEQHSAVGDRANDSIRINGKALGAKIVGEGGNLGLTQLGRIEYELHGGKVNTDFVDNVGGVDCSDSEVNIKILLDIVLAKGVLTQQQRDQLLYEMTDEVADIVLDDCYRQTNTISVSHLKAASQLREHIRFIHYLEKEGRLDRILEALPSDDELSERLAQGQGLTRPELAVLVAYGKMLLKESLVIPEISEQPYFQQILASYFPKALQKGYSDLMTEHPLRQEIIATQLANEVVNDMGFNFVYRMENETGSNTAEIVTCYMIAREVFQVPQISLAITALDNKITAELQTKMLFEVRRNVRRATRWFIQHRDKTMDVQQSIACFEPTFRLLSEDLEKFLIEEESKELVSKQKTFIEQGVSKEVARYIVQLSTIFSLMDVAQIAQQGKYRPALVAEMYFKLGAKLELHWFLQQITHQPVGNHWQALARAAYREELDWQQRAITSVVLNACHCEASCNADNILDNWLLENTALTNRWYQILAEFKRTQSHEFAMFSVALRELMLLSLNYEK